MPRKRLKPDSTERLRTIGQRRVAYRQEKRVVAQRMGARTKTDTGGRVEHTEAIGGTVVKELGIMAPQLREKGCRRVREPTGSGSGGRPQRKGPSDCLPKTQDSAKPQGDV